jgi:hypothetical protein
MRDFFLYFIFVGEIKQILETELQVPVSKMQLKGWKSGDLSDSVSIALKIRFLSIMECLFK